MINKREHETESTEEASLESEIAQRGADIELLTEAFATLEAGRTRPVNPSADSAFSLLVELVGSAPQRLEDRQVYEAKLEAARLSLKLAIEECEQRKKSLKALKEENRSQQANLLFQELLNTAGKFNAAIDSGLELLEQMKTLNSQIIQLRGDRVSVLQTTADLNEAPYCQIGSDRVVVRRRFDVKRS